MRKSMLVVECSDNDYMYGMLEVHESVTVEELQKKINQIKSELEDCDYGWCIEDVLEKLPEEWETTFESGVDVIQI